MGAAKARGKTQEKEGRGQNGVWRRRKGKEGGGLGSRAYGNNVISAVTVIGLLGGKRKGNRGGRQLRKEGG